MNRYITSCIHILKSHPSFGKSRSVTVKGMDDMNIPSIQSAWNSDMSEDSECGGCIVFPQQCFVVIEK